MLTEKANAICLVEVLKEYSDAEHILPMREIIAKMQSLYGIKIDRRTVYGAVALLIELGYDISFYEDNCVGYYLRDRELEPSEVLLLTDAVYSFPFIPTSITISSASPTTIRTRGCTALTAWRIFGYWTSPAAKSRRRSKRHKMPFTPLWVRRSGWCCTATAPCWTMCWTALVRTYRFLSGTSRPLPPY